MANGTGVKNRRLLLTKNSIMMLVMLVIIFLAIFAWYNLNKSVTATGISVTASKPDEVEIAVERNGKIGSYITTNGATNWTEGRWSDKANFDDPFQFTSDVTSDGLTFIIPAFSSTEDNPDAKADARTNGKIVNVNGIPKTGNQVKTNLDTLEEGETADYVKIPFYLRSQNPVINVNPNAYLAMAAEEGVRDDGSSGTTYITGVNSTRKSIYGNFTSDALVAAMRVSLTGGPVESISNNVATRPSGYSDESTFVWVPRPDLFLKIPAGVSEDDWTLLTGITSLTQGTNSGTAHYNPNFTRMGVGLEPGYTFKHSYYTPRYDTSNNLIGVSQVTNDTAENSNIAYKSDVTATKSLTNGSVPTLGASKAITGFQTSASPITMAKTDGTGNADFYVYKFYINVWIEGTDSEARRAMDNGKFSLHMEFGNASAANN
ncbi:MAG: hypothetical protein IJ932_02605 [Ruminococcus sp.]|nr:hypothetical protein [Ruminococcus sp.]